MEALGWISHVDYYCEAKGPSHAVIGHTVGTGNHVSRPILACGGSVERMPWSLNPAPRTSVCPRCAKEVSYKR